MNQNPEQKPSLLPKIIYGLVAISLLAAVFLGVDLWRHGQQTTEIKAQNTQLTSQINQLETKDQVGAAFTSKSILERAQNYRIEWSKVAADLLALENTTEDLKFIQFGVAPDGAVNLSGQTENIKSVAILLQALRESELYEGPFVPTVSGETGVYNFQLQFNYLGL